MDHYQQLVLIAERAIDKALAYLQPQIEDDEYIQTLKYSALKDAIAVIDEWNDQEESKE